ncbi:MAG: hypothetical protein VB997_02320, partial [Opitutales bacterium]
MPSLPKIKCLFASGCMLAAAFVPTLCLHGQKTVIGVVKGAPSRVPVGAKPVLPVSDAVVKSIANAAVVLAAQRLSFNMNDAIALKLLQLGERLDSSSERVLYLKGLMEAKQAIPPAVFGGRVDEGAFAKYLLDLAGKQKPSFFRLLSYSLVGLLQPSDRTVIIELHKLRQIGISTDFDSALRQLHLPFPTHLLKQPLPPALPGPSAKRIAEGAVNLAQREFQTSRQNPKGLQMLQFAKAIHPANANALLLEALLTSGQPISGIFTEVTEQAFFGYLNQALETGKNDPNLLLLLHVVILQHNPTAFKSVVAMQNAKKVKLPTDFKNVLARFNQARTKPVPGNGRLTPPTTSLSLDARLKNSKMVNLLTSRTWSLYSKSTGEQWFFEFRPVGPISYAQG